MSSFFDLGDYSDDAIDKLIDRRYGLDKNKDAPKDERDEDLDQFNGASWLNEPPHKPVTKIMHDVPAKEIEWLWPARIPLGKVSLFSGDPGLGKSIVSLDIAARVSRGAAWPIVQDELTDDSGATGSASAARGTLNYTGEASGTQRGTDLPRPSLETQGVPPDSAFCTHHSALTSGSVLLLNSEDDAEDTIRPRLERMNADLTKIQILTGIQRGERAKRPFSLATDIELLEEAIVELGDCRLVIIDPLTSYLGSVVSSNANMIRTVLDPLKELAAWTGVSILLVNHLNKKHGAAVHRSLGSISIIGMARAAWAFARDKDDPQRRLIVPLKNNIGPETAGMAYRIVDGAVEWDSERVTISADEALSHYGRNDVKKGQALEDATAWLQLKLADGLPVPQSEIVREAKDAGIAYGTLRRAKDAIKVVTKPTHVGGSWNWMLKFESDQARVAQEETHLRNSKQVA
jgi:putative DNA primase/helicase